MQYLKEIGWIVRDKYQGRSDPAVLVDDLKRLEKGEPIDYIIGWREFLGCRIDLSFRPLIPRPETEDWVEKAIAALKSDKRSKLKCLDIFAGSGCIGLAVLMYLPNVRMDFAEKSKKMVKQIKLNLKMNKLTKRAQVMESDIFSRVTEKYDYIFANPPYIPAGRKLSKSVTDWEPKAALFGATDGLAFIEKFLKQAKDHLNDGGKLYLEFDSGQKKKIEKLAKDYKYSSCQVFRDQFNRWRYATIAK